MLAGIAICVFLPENRTNIGAGRIADFAQLSKTQTIVSDGVVVRFPKAFKSRFDFGCASYSAAWRARCWSFKKNRMPAWRSSARVWRRSQTHNQARRPEMFLRTSLAMAVALAMTPAFAASKHKAVRHGVLRSVTVTTVALQPDGTTVTTRGPVDVKAYAAAHGLVAASDDCDGDGGDGGDGGGDGGDGGGDSPPPSPPEIPPPTNPLPPASDPYPSIPPGPLTPPNTNQVTETQHFADGWTTWSSWTRSGGSSWVETGRGSTPPPHGSDAGGSTQIDCDDEDD